MIRRPPRSTPFPTRRSSDLAGPATGRCNRTVFRADALSRQLRPGVRFDFSLHPGKPQQPDRLVRRPQRSEEHTSELQSRLHLVCRLLLEKKKTTETKAEAK